MWLALRGYNQSNALMGTGECEISQIYPRLLLRQRRQFLRGGNKAEGGVKVIRGAKHRDQSGPVDRQQPQIGVFPPPADHVEDLIHLAEQESGNGAQQRQRDADSSLRI